MKKFFRNRKKHLKPLKTFNYKNINYKKIATVFAVLVVIVTTYVLILPALTLDSTAASQEAGVEVSSESSSSSGESATVPSLESPVDDTLGSAPVTSSSDTTASSSETESDEPELITQQTTLTATNPDYVVTAVVDADAKLPKDVSLKVKEIKSDDADYQVNYTKAQNALTDKDIATAKFYDVSFEYNGQEVEPEANVKITIQPTTAIDAKDNLDILHFPDDGSTENISQKDVNQSDNKISSVSFESSQFSIFAVLTSTNSTSDDTTESSDDSTSSTSASLAATATTTHTVTFKYTNNDGVENEIVELSIEDGQTIGALPASPFRSGYRFSGWVDEDTGEEVTDDTVVTSDMTVVAQFSEITIYNVTINYYYYNNTTSANTTFDTEIYHVEADETPYRIIPPSSTKPEEDTSLESGTLYYPTQTIIELADADDLATKDAADGTVDNQITINLEYVPYTATYTVHYMLKDLDGSGYSEIESVENHGVLGSTIRPQVLTYTYANFEKTSSVTITEAEGQDLYVYYTRKSYTLSYDTNGGSYIAPTTDLYGTTVSISSTTPTKAGYTFAGWYDNADLTGTPVTDDVVLESDKTLYAKWEADTVNYTIAYYKEIYDNATNSTIYVYDSSRTASGKVGDTISATTAQGLSTVPTGYERESAYGKNSSSSITIEADGTSVLNVYYSLIRYTFIFNLDGPASSTRPGGGTTVTNGRISIGGQTYSGSQYQLTDVVLGQDISSVWPSSISDPQEIYTTSGNYKFDYWTEGNFKTKRYEVTEEMLPTSGTTRTYTAHWINTNNTVTVEYWLQQADGSYQKSDKYSQSMVMQQNSTLSAKEIFGYTYYTNQSFTHNGVSYTGSSGSTYRFYYNRNSYQIDYYYANTKVNTISDVLYEADISSSTYNYEPSRPSGVDSDYTWGGWYSDSLLTEPYTFDTMPNNNLVLYAKWVAPEYTVSFNLNGGDGTTPDSQTVEKYKVADEPDEPTREHYTFDGWYTADGERYDWSKPVTEDVELYAHWTLNPLTYTVKYVDGDNNDTKLSPDKVVTSPALTYGEEISEKAVAITGYRPDANSKSIELDYDNNVITFYYTQKASTVSYTVKYLLEDDDDDDSNNTVLKDPVTKTVDGNTVIVKEIAPDIPAGDDGDYYPTEEISSLTLTSNSENNVITFYYNTYDTGRVTVNYLDMDGNPIPGQEATVTRKTKPSTYTVSPPDISGYTYKEGKDVTDEDDPQDVQTTYTINGGEDIVINLYYQKDLQIDALDKEKDYDGEALASSGVSDLDTSYRSYLETQDQLTGITFTGSQTDAGTSATTPSDAVITDSEGNDRTYYYNIEYISGVLTVNPLDVTVVIDGDVIEKTYDGTYSTVTYNITSISDSLYSEDNIQFNGEDSDVSISKKNYGTYLLNLENKFSNTNSNFNVDFQVSNGVLIINQRKVTLTSSSATKAYDGTALTKEEVTSTTPTATEGFITGEGIDTLTFTGSQTDPGSSDNLFTYTLSSATDARNYDIDTEYGVLTVTPTINIQKTTTSWTALSGGEFEISVFDDDDSWTKLEDVTIDSTSGINISDDLTSGIYRIKETAAPDGYRILNDYIYFTITETTDDDGQDTFTVALSDADGNALDSSSNAKLLSGSSAEGYSNRIQIADEAGSALPSSGGIGTHKIIIAGVILMLIAVLGGVIIRLRSAASDSS